MRIVVALLAVALLAPVAAGHTGLGSAQPADGAVVGIAPERIVLTFAAPFGRPGDVSVTGPSGRDLAATARRDPRDARRLIVGVGPDGAGAYDVRWAIVAADGHDISGTMSFRARRGSVARSTEAVRRAVLEAAATMPTSA